MTRWSHRVHDASVYELVIVVNLINLDVLTEIEFDSEMSLEEIKESNFVITDFSAVPLKW